jgi:flagellar biosynthesis protein FlhF
MQIKRFKARDVRTALNMVKEELGPEAVILSTREIKDRGDLGPAFEVTAGAGYHPPSPTAAVKAYTAAGGYASPSPASANPAKAAKPSEEKGPSLAGLGTELAEIKGLILDMTHRAGLTDRLRDRPDMVRLYRELLERELDPALARGLVEKVAEQSNGGGAPYELLNRRLRRLLKTNRPFGGGEPAGPRHMALVGPSGVGKTTTLAKLAAHFSMKEQRKVAIISLDTFRLGAADQLRTYARIMGLPVRVVQDREEFRQAMELFENMDLVLIDTSGRCLTHRESMDELRGALGDLPSAKVLLVLSAATKDRDLAWAIEQTEKLPVEGLVISKLDETRAYGNVVNNLIKYKKPVSFLTNGQKVPEDIIPATPDRLAGLIAPDPSLGSIRGRTNDS